MLEMYRTHYKVYLGWALQYRAMLGFWAVAGIVETLVALAIWSTVAHAAGGEVGGYSKSTFAAYFVIQMLVSEMTHTWTFWMWDWRIREGTFSSLLLRPSHPVHADIIDNIATKTISMTIKIPIAILIGTIFGAQWNADATTLTLFVVVLALAYALRTIIEAVIACAAFWLTKISALIHGYYLLFVFLSGQFAPISLMPDWLQTIANLLPFRWIIDFPVQLAMGRLSNAQIVHGMWMLVAWIAVSFALFRVAWRLSSKRYSAVGS